MAINERVCSNNVDRVNGLNFLLCLEPIPVYQENDTVEKAWARSWSILHESLSKAIRVELNLSDNRQPTWQDLLDHLKITPRMPSPKVVGVDKLRFMQWLWNSVLHCCGVFLYLLLTFLGSTDSFVVGGRYTSAGLGEK